MERARIPLVGMLLFFAGAFLVTAPVFPKAPAASGNINVDVFGGMYGGWAIIDPSAVGCELRNAGGPAGGCRVNYAVNDTYSAQLGGIYLWRAWRLADGNYISDTIVKYIDVPLVLRVAPLAKRRGLGLRIVGSIGFRLAADHKDIAGGAAQTQDGVDYTDFFKGIIFSAGAGCGYRFHNGIMIEADYLRALTNMSDLSGVTIKHHGFMLLAGYGFKIH